MDTTDLGQASVGNIKNDTDQDNDIYIPDIDNNNNINNNQCQTHRNHSDNNLEETVNNFITNTRQTLHNEKVVFSMKELCEIITEIQRTDEIRQKKIMNLISSISQLENNPPLKQSSTENLSASTLTSSASSPSTVCLVFVS